VFKPNEEHTLTEMSREENTVITALRARPHFDFTISIFSEIIKIR